MSDTPDPDRAIAETVYAAFGWRATRPAHPLEELAFVTRLVEAIRPKIDSGSPGAIVEAAEAAPSAWKPRDPDGRGPRVVAVNHTAGCVALG